MYGTPFLFLLTVAIFAFILIRRNRERAFRNTIEGIAKLGVADRITAHSTIFMPAVLLEIVLRPKPEEGAQEKSEEVRVPWQSDEPEMLTLQISSHSNFAFPKFLPAMIMGKEQWYELRPIVAKHAGIWRLARLDEEVVVRGKTRKVKRVLSTRDFLVTGERVGVVTHKVWMQEVEENHYYAPSQGYPLSLQVSDGTEVEPGDILVIMAIPTGKPLSEKPN